VIRTPAAGPSSGHTLALRISMVSACRIALA
jgi:hypothetical protein